MSSWKPNRDLCVYTACYCEENIWKLCELWKEKHPDHIQYLYAVFISNEKRQVPIWKQNSSTDHEQLAIWDYHVILVDKSSDKPVVYDFDSSLGFSVLASEYIKLAIRDESEIPGKFHRIFRIVPAEDYLRTFASDRTHMLNDDKTTYQSQPPDYPPIRNEKSTNNIQDFIDVTSKQAPGRVMNLSQFIDFLGIN